MESGKAVPDGSAVRRDECSLSGALWRPEWYRRVVQMVLMTARPFKHPRTGVYYFRKAVPHDLRAAVGKWEEKRTLGTKDPAEACRRHREIAAAVEQEWSALRSPPMTPTSHVEPKLLKLGELEQWLGASLDGYAGSMGMCIPEVNRSQILRAIDAVCRQAVQARKCDAEEGYGPASGSGPRQTIPNSQTAPAVPTSSANGIGGVTLTALIDGWWKEAKVGGTAEATRIKYARAVLRLGKFLGHSDAAKVIAADIVRFKDHRLSAVDPTTGKSLSSSTVRSGDLAPLKTVFGWGLSNLHLPSNPAEKITMKVGKPQRLRSKAFTDAEAMALLTAATGVVRDRETPKALAAKRWVPWLCAYTGARVGEMVQLRRQDLRQEGDLWVVHITPEAGTVKTNEARDVVLHPHLVEMGFPSVVAGSAAGPLFLTPTKAGDVRQRLSSTTHMLGKAARQIVSDEGVAPNHGWRHRFKTVCRDAGIAQRIMDAIQGHSARSESDNYGDVSLQAQALALARFPRQGC